MIHFYKNILF